jgi:hypothetical protein
MHVTFGWILITERTEVCFESRPSSHGKRPAHRGLEWHVANRSLAVLAGPLED